jgi:hypothetical protein
MIQGNLSITERKGIFFPRYRQVWFNTDKVKVKFTLEQAMKAQRGSRSIALLFL